MAVRSPSRLLGGPEPFAATLLRELETIRLLRLLARDVKLGELPLAILPRLVFERALERVPLGSRATTREVLGVRARAYSSSTSRIASRTSSESISPFAARFSARTSRRSPPCASRASRVSTSADAKHPKVSRVRRRVRRATLLLFCRRRLRGRPRRVRSGFCLARRLSTPNRFLHRRLVRTGAMSSSAKRSAPHSSSPRSSPIRPISRRALVGSVARGLGVATPACFLFARVRRVRRRSGLGPR